jgi:hypothetical protein
MALPSAKMVVMTPRNIQYSFPTALVCACHDTKDHLGCGVIANGPPPGE